jgi:hypothetical protein
VRDRRRPSVYDANRARTPKDMYARMGFRPVGTTRSFARPG